MLRARPRCSTILDPIEISAILLECARQRCLIFSFDLMIVGSELQNMILAKLQRLGFRPDEIVLLASHTHYAPATDQACACLGIPEVEFVNDVAEPRKTWCVKLNGSRLQKSVWMFSRGT